MVTALYPTSYGTLKMPKYAEGKGNTDYDCQDSDFHFMSACAY